MAGTFAEQLPERKGQIGGGPLEAPDSTSARVSRKQMKIKTTKIAFICFYLFFRIGTFQWITSEKIKKFLSPSTRVSGCCAKRLKPVHPPLLPPDAAQDAGSIL